MFAAAESSPKVDKQSYESEIESLRVDLVNAQYDLQEADFSVVILIAGDDWPACVEALQSMQEWMDARYLEMHPLDPPKGPELTHPWLWRYWQRLPRRGRIGVFLDAWPNELIRNAMVEKDGVLERRLEHAERFERTLVENGTVLLKFWFHLGEEAMKRRLKKAKKSPEKYWWVDEEASRGILRTYDEGMPAVERVISRTSTSVSPWQVIGSEDDRHRNLSFARGVHAALMERLSRPQQASAAPTALAARGPEEHSVLSEIDLDSHIDRAVYRQRLEELFTQLRSLTGGAREAGISSVLVFEGWDAAGKGGVIRRILRPIDARLVKVISIAAPTEEETAHHYLWRFWQRMPPAGKVTLFDRSWYGRVLVERVEGLTEEADWRRGYEEIRDFEEQIGEAGHVVLKFWLHIDPDEQLRRFKARENTAYKKHKITDEDYRNRDRWADYETAVDEMVRHTSTGLAPWHLVPANDKRFARIQVLETFAKALEQRLGGKP